MTGHTWFTIALFLLALVGLAKPLGSYMTRVYEGQLGSVGRWFEPVERAIYRAAGIDPSLGMNWKTYAWAMLVFNFIGFAAVYLLQRL